VIRLEIPYSIVIIKPDAFDRRQEILKHFSKYEKEILVDNFQFTKRSIMSFYDIHKDKPFFSNLIEFMLSGKVMILKVIGDNIISEIRQLVENEIRPKYGTDKTKNAIHASDSRESAQKEYTIALTSIINSKTSKIFITVDGVAKSGKTSICQTLSEMLDLHHLSSGKIYRAFTWACLQQPYREPIEVCKRTSIKFSTNGNVIVDGKSVDLEAREINLKVADIASIPEVRKMCEKYQHAFVEQFPKVIVDGRNLATEVFPYSDLKLFLTASSKTRALRGNTSEEDIDERDYKDTYRKTSPMKLDSSHTVIDSTNMDYQRTILEFLIIIHAYLNGKISESEDVDGRYVIIITGPASSGKTTLINNLQGLGYYVVPETATQVIQRWKSKNIPLPWEGGDMLKFQSEIYELDLKQIGVARRTNNRVIILDRSVEDTIAYVHNVGLDLPNWKPTYELFGIPKNNVKVYFLNILKVEDNGVRFQNKKEQVKEEYKFLDTEYKNSGYMVYRELFCRNAQKRVRNVVKVINKYC